MSELVLKAIPNQETPHLLTNSLKIGQEQLPWTFHNVTTAFGYNRFGFLGAKGDRARRYAKQSRSSLIPSSADLSVAIFCAAPVPKMFSADARQRVRQILNLRHQRCAAPSVLSSKGTDLQETSPFVDKVTTRKALARISEVVQPEWLTLVRRSLYRPIRLIPILPNLEQSNRLGKEVARTLLLGKTVVVEGLQGGIVLKPTHSGGCRIFTFREAIRQVLARSSFSGAITDVAKLVSGLASSGHFFAFDKQFQLEYPQAPRELLRFLKRHGHVYLKGAEGSGGKGIASIDQDIEGGIKLRIDSADTIFKGLSQSDLQSEDGLNRLIQRIEKTGQVIVESTIPYLVDVVTNADGSKSVRRVEFRFIVVRDKKDERWRVAAHYAKCSTSELTANISTGGSGEPIGPISRRLIQALRTDYSEEEVRNEARAFRLQLRNLSHRIASALEEMNFPLASRQTFCIDYIPIAKRNVDGTAKLDVSVIEMQGGFGYSGLKLSHPLAFSRLEGGGR